MNLRIHPLPAFLFALFFAASELMAQGTRDINKGQTNFTSLDGESRIGRQAAVELERTVTLVDDGDLTGYIDRIAQSIAKNSDSRFPITIKVIQSNDVNASALPGGFIYINTGTIRAVDNEAELAFVIAQLVGHVAARHATENNSKAILLQTAMIPAITSTGGISDTAIKEMNQIALPVSMFKFSRGAVKEADYLGLEYLYKAGYDPQAAVSFLKKVEALEALNPKESPLFATSPPAAERIAAAEANIKTTFPARAPSIQNTPEFNAVKARVK